MIWETDGGTAPWISPSKDCKNSYLFVKISYVFPVVVRVPVTHRKGMNALSYYKPLPKSETPNRYEADVCVYTANASGIIAAVKLRRAGYTVALVEPGTEIGGLTAGGLGATDVGRKEAFGGMSRQFYRDLGAYYGNEENWTFEPHVAEAVLQRYLDEAGITVHFRQHLAEALKEGNEIRELVMENGDRFRAKYFIDASYEGDLLAKAGVSYIVGRESNDVYGETFNGMHFGHPNHNFRRFVDPYKIEGDPSSGLCYGISEDSSGRHGDGDHRVQAYNFRLCLTDRDDIKIPFPCPPDYDPERYEVLRRYIRAGVWDALWLNKEMPNRKSDTNNFGGFSTDHIGANYAWPEASYAEREAIFQDHVNYQMGLLYFLANDPDLPAFVREDVGRWGLAGDEFRKTGGWPHALYVREGRRMVNDHVITEHHAFGRFVADDSIALAAYQMDSHNCRRIVLGGRVYNEGNVELGGFNPFGISYRSICPREKECANLIVSWSIAASHIAFGSIRMEPVGMALGESAAEAIILALETQAPVQQVSVKELRQRLAKAGQIIHPPHLPVHAGVRPFAQ